MNYYDFRINGQPAGYFECSESEEEIYQSAVLSIDGKTERNTFRVALHHGRPTKFKIGDGRWYDVPEGTYPSSTYPLLLREGVEHYLSLDEGSGEVSDVELHYDGDTVTELVDGVVRRRFRTRNGVVVWISWGGTAESTLKNSKAEAFTGSPLAEHAPADAHYRRENHSNRDL